MDQSRTEHALQKPEGEQASEVQQNEERNETDGHADSQSWNDDPSWQWDDNGWPAQSSGKWDEGWEIPKASSWRIKPGQSGQSWQTKAWHDRWTQQGWD
eukprot:5444363-Amphidinium_carterae.1